MKVIVQSATEHGLNVHENQDDIFYLNLSQVC